MRIRGRPPSRWGFRDDDGFHHVFAVNGRILNLPFFGEIFIGWIYYDEWEEWSIFTVRSLV